MASTPTTPSTGNSASRRDEILEFAAQVIADRGIKDATVRDIGEAAGILSGSLYYHFDSKEQIVLELLKPSTDANYASAVAICAEHRGIAALALLIRNAVMSTAANPVRSIILRNEERAFREYASLAPIAEYQRKLFKLWLGVVNDAIEMGELRADCDADIVVLAIVDTTLGGSRWFSGKHRKDPESVADALITLHLDGVRA
jgi:AcrR family transcriptional regulator